MSHATRDWTLKTVQPAADLAMPAGRKLSTDAASRDRLRTGAAQAAGPHPQQEYARGDVQEQRAAGL